MYWPATALLSGQQLMGECLWNMLEVFSAAFACPGPIRDVQSTLLPSPSCLHYTLKFIPHFCMDFTSIVRWGPLRSALCVVLRYSSIICCITFLNNTSVIRRKRCNSSTMTWFNGMSINYPVDIYTHKFWCSYNTIDVYTCHSHRQVLWALFT